MTNVITTLIFEDVRHRNRFIHYAALSFHE